MEKNKIIKKESPTNKLNNILGIENIDEMLNDLDIPTGDDNGISNILNDIDVKVKDAVKTIDNQTQLYNSSNGDISLHTIQSSLGEISELILISKKIIKHVYEIVVTSELIDPEVIGSIAKMIEASRIAVADYIELYKDRIRFYNTLQLEYVKHQNKKELLERKHQMDLEKKSIIDNKENDEEIENMLEYTQERIVKAINNYEKSQIVEIAETD